MNGENLDAQLEPIAQALILILFLVGIASLAFFVINKIAVRRKERAHNKLSTSRRSSQTWVDLGVGREAQGEDAAPRSSRGSRKRRSHSDHVMLDILAKPKAGAGPASTPDETPPA